MYDKKISIVLVYESISQFMKNNVLKENKGILFLFESLFASTFTFFIIQSIFDLMEKAEQHITYRTILKQEHLKPSSIQTIMHMLY